MEDQEERFHLAKVTLIQGLTFRDYVYSNKLFLEDQEKRSHLAKVSLIQDLNSESICCPLNRCLKTKLRIYEDGMPSA